MSMPDTSAGAVSRDGLRGLARSWWLFLTLGILWILFGMFVLSYNVGSLLALAVFAGITFVCTGITQLAAAGRAESRAPAKSRSAPNARTCLSLESGSRLDQRSRVAPGPNLGSSDKW
jgi:uncharacterized membrane protein HdeD (DUF308 family)